MWPLEDSILAGANKCKQTTLVWLALPIPIIIIVWGLGSRRDCPHVTEEALTVLSSNPTTNVGDFALSSFNITNDVNGCMVFQSREFERGTNENECERRASGPELNRPNCRQLRNNLTILPDIFSRPRAKSTTCTWTRTHRAQGSIR